jgi:hypothetical protein
LDEQVKALLMEESNIHPVQTPVTICGDIHGKCQNNLYGNSFSNESLTDFQLQASFLIYWNYFEWEENYQPQTTFLWYKIQNKVLGSF